MSGGYEKGHGSGIKRGGSGLHVRKAGYPAPGEQPYLRRGDPVPLTSMDPIERSRLVKLPEVQFLKRRLPGEPLVGPWK